MIFILFAIVASCGGCASTLALPGEGGPRWVRYRAGQVELSTDVEPELGEALAVELDQRYQAIASLSFKCARRDGDLPQMRVVMFSDRGNYEQFGPSGTAGYFVAPNRLAGDRDAVAVFHGGRADEETVRVFQHELAHRLAHRCFARMPTWLNEGLATVLETTKVEESGGLRLGVFPYSFGRDWEYFTANDTRVLMVPRRRMPELRKLLEMDASEFYAEDDRTKALHYAGAWALTHMLLLGVDAYRERFRTYASLLMTGDASATAAWNDAFAGVGVEERYESYLRDLDFPMYEARFSPKAHPVRSEALSDTYVRILWARISRWEDPAQASRADLLLNGAAPGDGEQAALLIARAERALARGDSNAAWRLVRDALAAAPKDRQTLEALVALGIERGDLKSEPVRRAAAKLSKAAPSVTTDLLLGSYELASGRLESSQAFLVRALRSSMACWQCLMKLAEIASKQGDWKSAREAYRQTLHLVPEYLPHIERTLRERYREASQKSAGEEPAHPPAP